MIQQVLKQCTVEGTVVKLPNIQLDRKQYVEVKNKLELIGGKWKGGKVQGFVFEQDPSDLLSQIANGEQRNLKKEYQFFPTPPELADILISHLRIKPTDKILEPSAGRGNLIDAIRRKYPDLPIDCYELMELNRSILEKYPNTTIQGSDFLTSEKVNHYDIVAANPPFTKNQDIDHIYKMYDVASSGGQIATIASKSWQTGSQKKQIKFRGWLDSVGAAIIDVDAGAFKESGTNVASVIILIEKK